MASGLPPLISDASVTLSFSFTWPDASGTTYAQHAYYGYCTVADAQFEFANVKGMPTLTSSVIAQEICYSAQELQEALDYSYEMPYGGSDQNILAKLRELNAKAAAARIVNRYFTGSSPNKSTHGDELQAWVAEQLMAIETGLVRWDTPYGDALPRAALPVPNRRAIFSWSPSATSGTETAEPIFTMGRWRFRRNDVI